MQVWGSEQLKRGDGRRGRTFGLLASARKKSPHTDPPPSGGKKNSQGKGRDLSESLGKKAPSDKV